MVCIRIVVPASNHYNYHTCRPCAEIVCVYHEGNGLVVLAVCTWFIVWPFFNGCYLHVFRHQGMGSMLEMYAQDFGTHRFAYALAILDHDICIHAHGKGWRHFQCSWRLGQKVSENKHDAAYDTWARVRKIHAVQKNTWFLRTNRDAWDKWMHAK